MRIAEVVEVRVGIAAPTPKGTRIFNVWYTFNGSRWKGSIAAKDELEAWAKFQARLDYEGSQINGYGKSTAQAEES